MAPTTTPAATAAAPAAASTPAATTTTAARGSQHRPILAERFRTKLCLNFVERGTCPYVHRCMFAHGDAEMRTTAQNVADRLFSEDAIRSFKRRQYETKLLAATAANATAATSPAASPLVDGAALPSSVATADPMPPSPVPPLDDRASYCGTPPPQLGAATVAATVRRVRRHDPYALKSEWHPYGGLDQLHLHHLAQSHYLYYAASEEEYHRHVASSGGAGFYHADGCYYGGEVAGGCGDAGYGGYAYATPASSPASWGTASSGASTPTTTAADAANYTSY